MSYIGIAGVSASIDAIVPVTEGDRESIAIHVAGFTTTNMGNTCSSVHIALTGDR